jgi:hypothetical protein
VLRSHIRAALEADGAGRADRPTSPEVASTPLRLVASNSTPHPARGTGDPSLGRALRDLALLVGIVVVVVILVIMAVIAVSANL